MVYWYHRHQHSLTSEHRDHHPLPYSLSPPWGWGWQRWLWIKESLMWPFTWILFWWVTLHGSASLTAQSGLRQARLNVALGSIKVRFSYASPTSVALFCWFSHWDCIDLLIFPPLDSSGVGHIQCKIYMFVPYTDIIWLKETGKIWQTCLHWAVGRLVCQGSSWLSKPN